MLNTTCSHFKRMSDFHQAPEMEYQERGKVRPTHREKNKSVQEPKEDKCKVHLEIVNLQEHTKANFVIRRKTRKKNLRNGGSGEVRDHKDF